MSATPVGKALEKVIWEVHQCEQILAAGGSSDERIVDKLEDLVKTLPSLRAAAAESEAADDDARSATLLPVSALRLVDEGRCPTRGMVDGLLAVGEANAATKGKTNVFARLHAELEAQNGAQPRADASAGAVETPAAAKTTPTKRKRGR
jgi:mediator of RNA polymerase II transcription subunit 10